MFSLFRLIKLTADFDYVTFVLAMDCDAVARTVGRRFGGDEQGRRFLEKIVQVPVRLPTVPPARLRGFTLGLLQQVLDDLGTDFDDKETRRFRETFDSCLVREIRTPRAAKQYANVVRFGLGLLPGEVNPVDVMLLEGIRLLFPDVFHRMQEELVRTDEQSIMWQLEDRREERVEKLLDRIVPKDHPASANLRTTLTALFPVILGRHDASENSQRQWAVAQRVACDEYFLRYLASAVPDSDVPDSEMVSLQSLADGGQSEAVVNLVRQGFVPKTALIFIKKLRLRESGMTDRQRASLAVAVAKCADSLAIVDVAWQAEMPLGKAAIFSALCVENFSDRQSREGLTVEVLQAASSTVWAIEFFSWLPHRRETEPDESSADPEKLFDETVTSRLGNVLAELILKRLEALDALPQLHCLHRMIGHCAWNSNAQQQECLKAWVRNRLELEPAFLNDLCAMCMTWSYGPDGRSFSWPGNETALDSISRKVDTAWLISAFHPAPRSPTNRRRHELSAEEAAYRVIEMLRSNAKPDAESNEASVEPPAK